MRSNHLATETSATAKEEVICKTAPNINCGRMEGSVTNHNSCHRFFIPSIAAASNSKHYYLMMSPYMIIFFLFTVIPVVISFGLSFFYFNMLEAPRLVGWDNYSRLFLNDDVFMIALKNTFLFAVITGPLSYIACFLFAWVINELSPFVRSLMTLVFLFA